MRTKRILSLLSAVCLVVALAAGCAGNGNGGSNSAGSNPADGASLSAADVYGEGLSEDTVAALQNSGTITLYTQYGTLAKGQPDDEQKAQLDFYKKYYGLNIKYKYQGYGDNLSKFLIDYSNNDAPDLISLDYRRWPKAGIRQVVFSIDELKEKGVVGLDHPEITRYEDIASRFRIGDRLYSPGITYADPSFLAYNVDLFDQYKVKNPGEYYKEGNWSMDTYIQCCKEITRELSDGTKIWGSFWRDATYYLVADDARLVDWDASGEKLKLTMTNPETVKALEVWADTYIQGYSPSAEQGGSEPFKVGHMGMFVCDANNFAQKAKDYTFKWDIVPTPLGSHNTSGNTPGECSGTGIVSSSKNPQGALNYCIATSLYRQARFQNNYGIKYILQYEGVYNKEQMDLIMTACDHIGLDLYMGVGNLLNVQWNFWNALKSGTMTTKEVFDTYEGVWQAEVDAENEAKAEAEKTNKK